jgi:DNA-binding LacI/PurR family transcriptional regulator
MRRPTIRDVARLAGVSHQTVSRVLNDEESVVASTREAVLAAIRQLNYVPNPSARGLSLNRTHTLGMVSSDISDYFFAQAVAGAEAEARRRGFFLIIGSVEEDADDDERAYLRLMLERRVEGLIVAWPTLLPDGSGELRSVTARVPLVVVASGVEAAGATLVDVDNRRGGLDATSLLIREGHRAIATITGPLEWPSARARLAGYRDALRASGLAEGPALVETCSDWGLASGQAAAARLLERGSRFTAVFAQSDLAALGAITELRARGIRVPEDVSVVGYDDLPIASFVDPPLTTVHQPMREVGALAVGLLVDEIALDSRGDGKPSRHLLPADLVVRGSVRPPAGRGS